MNLQTSTNSYNQKKNTHKKNKKQTTKISLFQAFHKAALTLSLAYARHLHLTAFLHSHHVDGQEIVL